MKLSQPSQKLGQQSKNAASPEVSFFKKQGGRDNLNGGVQDGLAGSATAAGVAAAAIMGRAGDYNSDLSSKISSVVLSEDGMTTYRSARENEADSKLNALAGALLGKPVDEAALAEETARQQTLRESNTKRRQTKLMDSIEREIRLQLLNATNGTGILEYRSLQKHLMAHQSVDGPGGASLPQGQIINKFSISYIMHTFSVDQLKLLRTQFKKKQKVVKDGFTLIEFVTLMKQVVPYEHPREETDLIHGLCQLFKEIDINDNGYMEWDEFTEFLVEVVDQKQLSSASAGLITGDELVSENILAQHVLRMEESQPDYLHRNNMLQVARAQIFQNFNLSNTFKDKLVRNTPIITALLYHATDTFITLESQQKCVKLLTAMSNQAIPSLQSATVQSTKVTQQIRLPIKGGSSSTRPVYILSAAFNEREKMVSLCSTEGLIYFYRRYGNQHDWKLFKIICSHGISPQVNMWYMEHHERWFSVGSQQKGHYSKKNIRIGSVQTLHQWHIPRSKLLSNSQMICPECQQNWVRAQGSQSGAIELQIEKPYVEEYNADGIMKADSELRYLVEPFEHMNHRDDVKDVKEIFHPFLAIITACHDGKLRIISTKLRRLVGILETGHQTGVRQLDFTPYHGASILSVGYESFFNLWEIDNSLGFGKQMQDIPTKFSLNTSPCIAARFLGQSVFSVAIDSQFCVKIWNYKKNTLMQTLQQGRLKMQDTITGLLIFSEGKFAVLSKHVTFYDTITSKSAVEMDPGVGQAASGALGGGGPSGSLQPLRKKELQIRRMILGEKGLSEIKQAAIQQRNNMINPPLDVVFLKSYQNFLVLTKDSLRLYNGTNGRLRMYLDNIVETHEASGSLSELSAMCLNAEHRMVYIGDIHGGIRCFNVNTGLQIKSLELPRGMLQRQGEASLKVNKEVVGMSYLRCDAEGGGEGGEEPRSFLVSAHWNNRMRVWEVQDIEQANHMRSGSAQEVFKEDVACVTASEHLSLIATGGTHGTIVLWDFELFKVEGVLVGSKMSIVALQFVDQFPLLVSVSACGIVAVYSVRSGPRKIRYHCLARFLNVSRDASITEKQPMTATNCAITGVACEVVTNERHDPHEKQLGELAANVKYFKYKKERLMADEEAEMDLNYFTKSVFTARHDVDIQEYTTHFNSSGATTASTQADPEEGTFQTSSIDQKVYAKFYPPFNNRETPEHLNIVYSDESGSLKWLDLTTFIRKPEGGPLTEDELLRAQEDPESPIAPCLSRCESYASSKIGFMPERRMEAKAGSLAASLHDIATKQFKMPPLILAARSVQSHFITQAHKGRINNIRSIEVPPYGFITCGNDKFVRIWSRLGSKMGEINLIKEGTRLHTWRFGYDWASKRQSEQEKANEIVQALKLKPVSEARSTEEDQAGEDEARKSQETSDQQDKPFFVTEADSKPPVPEQPPKTLTTRKPATSKKASAALDSLNKDRNSDDEKDVIVNNKHFHSRSEGDPGQKSRKSRKSLKQRKPGKTNTKWDVDELFPIIASDQRKKITVDRFNAKRKTVAQQVKMINLAIERRLSGRPGMASGKAKGRNNSSQQIQKRTMLSQQSTTERPRNLVVVQRGSADPQVFKKSSLRVHSSLQGGGGKGTLQQPAHKVLHTSQISFQLNKFNDEEAGAKEQPQSMRSQLDHSSSRQGDKVTRFEAQERHVPATMISDDSASSRDSATSSCHESGTGSPSHSESELETLPEIGDVRNNFTSEADQRLHAKFRELHNSRNDRLSQLLSRQASRKTIEMTGKSNAEIEKSSLEAKSFKIFEARFDKVSQRSAASMSNLRESTERTSATREHNQGVRKVLKAATFIKGKQGQPPVGLAPKTDTEPQLKKHHTLAEVHQETLLTGVSAGEPPSKKPRFMEQVNAKTDEHLQSLIEECESRHAQMQEFMQKQKEEKPRTSKPLEDYTEQVKEKLSVEGVAQARQKLLDELAYKRREAERASMLPPRANQPDYSYRQRSDKNSGTLATPGSNSKRNQSVKRSRFLTRMEKYINEAASNPRFDQKFMMKTSQSQAHIETAEAQSFEKKSLFELSQAVLRQSQNSSVNVITTTLKDGSSWKEPNKKRFQALKAAKQAHQLQQPKSRNSMVLNAGSAARSSLKQTHGQQNSRPLSRQSLGAKVEGGQVGGTGVTKLREMQRLIARQVTQNSASAATLSRPQSLPTFGAMGQVESGKNGKNDSDWNPGERPKSRVQEFIGKYERMKASIL